MKKKVAEYLINIIQNQFLMFSITTEFKDPFIYGYINGLIRGKLLEDEIEDDKIRWFIEEKIFNHFYGKKLANEIINDKDFNENLSLHAKGGDKKERLFLKGLHNGLEEIHNLHNKKKPLGVYNYLVKKWC